MMEQKEAAVDGCDGEQLGSDHTGISCNPSESKQQLLHSIHQEQNSGFDHDGRLWAQACNLQLNTRNPAFGAQHVHATSSVPLQGQLSSCSSAGVADPCVSTNKGSQVAVTNPITCFSESLDVGVDRMGAYGRASTAPNQLPHGRLDLNNGVILKLKSDNPFMTTHDLERKQQKQESFKVDHALRNDTFTIFIGTYGQTIVMLNFVSPLLLLP